MHPLPLHRHRLCLPQEAAAAQIIEGTAYEAARVRLGGRGWCDVLRPAAERRARSFLVEGDARGHFVAQWATPGWTGPFDTFRQEDGPLIRQFWLVSQALACALLPEADGPPTVAGWQAHAPQLDPCLEHGASTRAAARWATFLAVRYGLVQRACLACLLEDLLESPLIPLPSWPGCAGPGCAGSSGSTAAAGWTAAAGA